MHHVQRLLNQLDSLTTYDEFEEVLTEIVAAEQAINHTHFRMEWSVKTRDLAVQFLAMASQQSIESAKAKLDDRMDSVAEESGFRSLDFHLGKLHPQDAVDLLRVALHVELADALGAGAN